MTHWTHSFYPEQERLTGYYSSPVHPFHTRLAQRVTAALGRPGALLELGAGGGQFAVSAAQLGHQVTALDLWPGAGERTRQLAAQHAQAVQVVTGDFYTAELPGQYDAICYWDGFGVGEDTDQQRLLRRLPTWLTPTGTVFLEVYTPAYWRQHAGFTRREATYTQVYGFDPRTCRMTDTYLAPGQAPLTQSLRCYTPDALRQLLRPTGLHLTAIWPGGHYDPHTGAYQPQATLSTCMTYTALLRA